MGYGSYSYDAHESLTRERAHVPRQALFRQDRCHPLMEPHGVRFRESRDSDGHPNSLGIVFALDVTGSMGHIPELLARQRLPAFMKALLEAGVADPQVCFMAVGDAHSDRAPLQVGQFESSERQMDQWLTSLYLEGGGGTEGMESYELAMYFAAAHTDLDCWRKRGHRGYFFMTGDERPYGYVSRRQVTDLIGDTLEQDVPIRHVLGELQRGYEPFFLIPDLARRRKCERDWRELLGDRVICLEDATDTVDVAAGLVALCEGAIPDLDALAGHLQRGGLGRERLGAVIRALTPFAATLGRDGTPHPRLEDEPLPEHDSPSGLQRLTENPHR
ncbi:VWA domain-containing protein [Myxococcus sp. K15C18031901]|uniref:VWA domain-containing protein n=1 Tax=Myxococcus dinghuensis TaxID=2906761 RepID=UPI0020A827DF|nr:VWA domain-containing protein [Myxococcus dinghuensis]MCP3097471.1 VWA domain-containing protein [Myxococcus dinghuensis]